MNEKDFVKLCKHILVEYVNSRMTGGGRLMTEDDVYVVWMCKTLQNSKALLSTNHPDGMYYEMTYNGDKKELYVDAYKKRENVAVDLSAEFPENAIYAGAADGQEAIGLEGTIPLMTSADYKERFQAEYYQLRTRIDKLTSMLSAWESGVLGFQPTCSFDLLEAQLNSMRTYLHFLKERAEIESISLSY